MRERRCWISGQGLVEEIGQQTFLTLHRTESRSCGTTSRIAMQSTVGKSLNLCIFRASRFKEYRESSFGAGGRHARHRLTNLVRHTDGRVANRFADLAARSGRQ